MNKAVEEIVWTIKESLEYKKCLELKKLMQDNDDIKQLIAKIKLKQKEYVKYETEDVKEELDELEKKLEEIPLYYEYNKYLTKVNEMINLVKDELNDYFDKLLNEEAY